MEWEKAIPVMALMGVLLTAALQLVQVLATGRPLLMGLSGVAAVTRDQRPASRGRMLWRWCVGWAPLWLLMAVFAGYAVAGVPLKRSLPDICLVWLAAYLLLIVCALLIPRRSLLDRLAGTWLVAR